jgi:hypothetical protein
MPGNKFSFLHELAVEFRDLLRKAKKQAEKVQEA